MRFAVREQSGFPDAYQGISELFFQSGTIFVPKCAGASNTVVWFSFLLKCLPRLVYVGGVNAPIKRYHRVRIAISPWSNRILNVLGCGLVLICIWCSSAQDSDVKTVVRKTRKNSSVLWGRHVAATLLFTSEISLAQCHCTLPRHPSMPASFPLSG